ncbi:MaoC family dehydratase N-terminal domain-containing protein [Pseudomonas sp. PNP]|uniref:FAS1-like dehydratase domain-containing protein n=1 Tax=Pseudomonas sp. PNP TaxID=361819 RepID=UPI001AECFCF9|nr:MaoC family dehydratase N-terminal domain-containing protein [Pseudomonas sp. PNP]MBP2839282.1 MaoC family dehydratase N-terminal domain-containing protein [Pseudomonas sp. PNP]
MSDNELGQLQQWLGRKEVCEAVITPQMLDAYRATLSPHLWEENGIAPPGLHWCLAPTTISAYMDELGEDGHPRRGGFLPPVLLPRRMWAGGEVQTLAPLPIGEAVRRESTITDIRFKDGRSGKLCFVTVEHELSCKGKVAIRERQDIVYRAAQSDSPAPSAGEPLRHGDRQEWVETPATLLLRYSAMTFNAHRIHYDLPYATEVEGYKGLVVHGPLQASLLFNLAARHAQRIPARFAYRGLTPLISGQPFRMGVSWQAPNDSLQAWTQDAEGKLNMEATATC